MTLEDGPNDTGFGSLRSRQNLLANLMIWMPNNL